MAKRKQPDATPKQLVDQIVAAKWLKAIKEIVDPRMRKYQHRSKGKGLGIWSGSTLPSWLSQPKLSASVSPGRWAWSGKPLVELDEVAGYEKNGTLLDYVKRRVSPPG